MKKVMKGDQFKITEAHLKLAKRMYVGWCGDEFGAPEINPKRPYGNSDVVKDILTIVGLPFPDDDVPEHLSDYARQIHEDMQVVLQICLVMQSFETGKYELQESYDVRSWKKLN